MFLGSNCEPGLAPGRTRKISFITSDRPTRRMRRKTVKPIGSVEMSCRAGIHQAGKPAVVPEASSPGGVTAEDAESVMAEGPEVGGGAG